MNFGFDIDGVISDFVRSFVKVVKKHYNLTLIEADIYCHDLNLVLGISKRDTVKLIRETLLDDLELISGAKETLVKLESEGNQIFLLTARPSDLGDVTKSWLEKKGIPHSRIIQLNEGEKYLAKVDLDLIVEDNLEDAIEWSQKVKSILVFDHPWNQTFNALSIIKRVYSWDEICKEIEQLKVASFSEVC